MLYFILLFHLTIQITLGSIDVKMDGSAFEEKVICKMLVILHLNLIGIGYSSTTFLSSETFAFSP